MLHFSVLCCIVVLLLATRLLTECESEESAGRNCGDDPSKGVNSRTQAAVAASIHPSNKDERNANTKDNRIDTTCSTGYIVALDTLSAVMPKVLGKLASTKSEEFLESLKSVDRSIQVLQQRVDITHQLLVAVEDIGKQLSVSRNCCYP